MLLRASSRKSGFDVDLRPIIDPDAGDGGVENGSVLLAFADAITGEDDAWLDRARWSLVEAMGEAALVDASTVAATFNMNDRIADATGIPLDSFLADASKDVREELGLDIFRRTHE